uniref:Uncharacterized protein n=1 Tax=Arundo donax TaxID=35708 RepID=A0A0A9R4S9_ARUDO
MHINTKSKVFRTWKVMILPAPYFLECQSYYILRVYQIKIVPRTQVNI